jgi:hypothetical protein
MFWKSICALRHIYRLAVGGDVRSKAKAITPVWAQRIEVERQGDDLLVTGWGHIPSPLSSLRVPEKDHSKLDILQRLRRYALRHLGQHRENPEVYQFAGATDDDKLIDFVGEFGPMSGEVLEYKPESGGTWTVTVRETLKALRREQRQFLGLVQIVQQVNRNTRADFDTLCHLLADLEIDTTKPHDFFRMADALLARSQTPSKSADLLPTAHWALCNLFSYHQPRLFPIDGEVIELPDVRPEGIQEALYFQLRHDYLAQREIGTCLHCGGHFPVFRHGTRGCKELCRRALRNNAYWTGHKETINAVRRGKNQGEE